MKILSCISGILAVEYSSLGFLDENLYMKYSEIQQPNNLKKWTLIKLHNLHFNSILFDENSTHTSHIKTMDCNRLN